MIDTPYGRRFSAIEQTRGVLIDAIRLLQRLGPDFDDPDAGPSLTASEVRSHMIEILARWAPPLLVGTDAEQTSQQELRYVLVAALDELLLHYPWAGADAWRENLLEDELFHSHVAGERFFAALEHLIAQRDPAKADIARVYLLLLSLGFQGKHRGDSTIQFDAQRRRLFTFVEQREPELETGHRRLFPQAYDYTPDSRADSRLARMWPWLAGLGAIIVLYILASHLIWRAETRVLRDILHHPPFHGQGAT